MKVSISLFLIVFFACPVFAQTCAYKLFSPKYEFSKNLADNISINDISVYMEYINNPLVASLVHLSHKGTVKQELEAKKIIEDSYQKYQLSAEILYKDLTYFDFSDAKQLAKSVEIRKSIRTKWQFVNFEVAKFHIENSKNSSPEDLKKAKEIVSQNILTENGEGLFYLALYDMNYGNKVVSDGGFVAAAEAGFIRAYPYMIQVYERQGESCREYYEVYELIFNKRKVKG